jgi:2,3-bisphosphoglycerate-independent phosphoglycerate mutase
VTDGLDNDYEAQAAGALEALEEHALAVIHIEAPDEAAHAGSVDDKIEAIQRIDAEAVGQFLAWGKDTLRILAMPDHATPIQIQTHASEPVPFVLWGQGLAANGASVFTEAQAKSTGLLIEEGHNIMGRLILR